MKPTFLMQYQGKQRASVACQGIQGRAWPICSACQGIIQKLTPSQMPTTSEYRIIISRYASLHPHSSMHQLPINLQGARVPRRHCSVLMMRKVLP